CGFNPEGGSRDHRFSVESTVSELGRALSLSWLPKVSDGFFMRAESFYNFATYIEQVSDLRAYGGVSLHEQSHAESFLALFVNRFEQGLYILDEPEAALTPHRQLSFLRGIHQRETSGQSPFRISAHSPMLTAPRGRRILPD